MSGRRRSSSEQITFSDFYASGDCPRCHEKDREISALKAEIEALENKDANNQERARQNAEATIRGWKKKHRDHPVIWREIVLACEEVVQSGLDRYAMQAIWERLRWHKDLRISDDEPFKLSHNYRSIYGHMIRAIYPEFGHLFTAHGGYFADARPWEEVWAEEPDREAQDRNVLERSRKAA